jgi:hypothetical protein
MLRIAVVVAAAAAALGRHVLRRRQRSRKEVRAGRRPRAGRDRANDTAGLPMTSLAPRRSSSSTTRPASEGLARPATRGPAPRPGARAPAGPLVAALHFPARLLGGLASAPARRSPHGTATSAPLREAAVRVSCGPLLFPGSTALSPVLQLRAYMCFSGLGGTQASQEAVWSGTNGASSLGQAEGHGTEASRRAASVRKVQEWNDAGAASPCEPDGEVFFDDDADVAACRGAGGAASSAQPLGPTGPTTSAPVAGTARRSPGSSGSSGGGSGETATGETSPRSGTVSTDSRNDRSSTSNPARQRAVGSSGFSAGGASAAATGTASKARSPPPAVAGPSPAAARPAAAGAGAGAAAAAPTAASPFRTQAPVAHVEHGAAASRVVSAARAELRPQVSSKRLSLTLACQESTRLEVL